MQRAAQKVRRVVQTNGEAHRVSIPDRFLTAVGLQLSREVYVELIEGEGVLGAEIRIRPVPEKDARAESVPMETDYERNAREERERRGIGKFDF